MKSNAQTTFADRHIGLRAEDISTMLNVIGCTDIEELIRQTIPADIRLGDDLGRLPEPMSENELLRHMKHIAHKNIVATSLIGRGYYNTVTPPVILRNILENPGWYTQYTPYQAEISQGRLEALLNFQTVIAELTGFEIANASLLDEGTAAAEAMLMAYAIKNKRIKKDEQRANVFLVHDEVYLQTIDVLRSRANALDIELEIVSLDDLHIEDKHFGLLIQYPGQSGIIPQCMPAIEQAKQHDILSIMACDLLSLTLIAPPAALGADVAIGNAQRLGIPLGAGGPHPAFFACREEFKRIIPGRIIGVSRDRFGQPAYRMALQTREQHIKREKATSNICTAQALLAIMAGFYAVYHGPDGLRNMALSIHEHTIGLAKWLSARGIHPRNRSTFDTLTYDFEPHILNRLRNVAQGTDVNFHYHADGISLSFDETTDHKTVHKVKSIFERAGVIEQQKAEKDCPVTPITEYRFEDYLQQKVFHQYRDETSIMRYMKTLENRDLSLMQSMIPLGSCTMKLNAAAELMPLSWMEFSSIHPFAPVAQREGYMQIVGELSAYLCAVTGFAACSLMPNSGAQGEFAGLKVIQAYHAAQNDHDRRVMFIPSSAHGTNPASAVMAGTEVVVIPCDEKGNIIQEALAEEIKKYGHRTAGLMVTYPSTHGVFEEGIRELTAMIHEVGGLVYMDGANMNAQIGYTSPAQIGADVCHINLHKTFAIPHGGGGPGMGPICCNEKLAPFLPNHLYEQTGGAQGIHAVSSAPYGSASILLISYAYIRLLGWDGLKKCTEAAILSANYMMTRLSKDFNILYTGRQGRCAHEFILDVRPFKEVGVQAEDIAKRMMDYGFHAPTLSFPVAGTFMIEPTESESLMELDLFIETLKSIKSEIDAIAQGDADATDNLLLNAPHPLHEVTADNWTHPYTREAAAYPLPVLRNRHKFWTPIGRVDNAFGDRNLMCTCPPVDAYMTTDLSMD